MRPALRALVAGGLGFAVSLIAACGGGSHLLSSDQASTLSAQLDAIQSALNNRDCAGVSSGLNQLSDQIAGVSNATARQNLTQGVTKLQQLARQDCPGFSTKTTTTATTTTATTTTQSTPTVTTQTQTTATTPPATTPTITGTTTSPTAGSGGAGIGPGNSGNAPGHTK